MKAAPSILVTLIISFTFSWLAWADDFSYFLGIAPTGTTFIPIRDSYPDRELFFKNAPAFCQAAFGKNNLSTVEVQQVVEKFLLSKATLVRRTDSVDFGWTIDFSFSSGSGSRVGAFLRLLRNKSYYTISLRQSESSIESIAAMNFNEKCENVDGARFTFYNSELRPIRRVKLNSEGHEIQSVVMEEPVKHFDVEFKSENILRIGIIDSGLDYNHKDLIKKSRPMLGLDLTDPKRPPFDYTNSIFNEMSGKNFSHGSAVADVASRDVDVLIVPARTENKSYLDGAAAEYLATKKVRIINISQGGTKENDWLSLKAAIENHPEILFIASSGNETSNLEKEAVYPSVFSLPNLLVVASVNSQQELSSFSNYGAKYVHFAALGEGVIAAKAGGGQWKVSGTSFAAPLVTNIAAKLLVENPKLTTQALRSLLVAKAKQLPALVGKVQYGVLGF